VRENSRWGEEPKILSREKEKKGGGSVYFEGNEEMCQNRDLERGSNDKKGNRGIAIKEECQKPEKRRGWIGKRG